MPKLIDSDGLVLATTMELCEGCEEMKGCGDCLVNAFITLINDCPTIEAEPVKHGHWVILWDRNDPDTASEARCSACKRISKMPLGDYCKWCGCKMDEVTQ